MAASTANSTTTADRLVNPELSFEQVTERILKPTFRRGFHPVWLAGFALSAAIMLMGVVSATWLIARGVGVWGLNIPVAWGFAIINFVWWIGIGHAGTLISAILLLLRQPWRTSINRFAEAMTLFAVACAGMFPLLHLGRITRFYYLLPYPNTLDLWPQWRSPLVWDVFAVMSYGIVSLLFWYVGLLPDLATMRDRAKRGSIRVLAGIFSLGWRGSAKHWQRFNSVYLLMAGLATPLVVSVHSIVSFDFSVGIVPGWHSTIFPPYFVAGAIYAGFAMVILLAIPLRFAFKLEDLITHKHFDQMAKVMLVSGLVVAYGYLMETFTAWFSGEKAEQYLIGNRAAGPYAATYWATIVCNVAAIQLCWFRRVRRSLPMLFGVAVVVSIGMWLERFVIVAVSLHRDYMPSAWGSYSGNWWDWSLFVGTLGLFATLFFVFIRFLPAVSIFEVREQIDHERRRQARAPQNGDAESATAKSTAEKRAVTSELTEGDDQYGVMGEYDDAQSLLEAARGARDAGFRRMDAYSPYPVEGLSEALGLRRTKIPRLAAIGAVLGGGGAYTMQWYASVVAYPLNIGGRPLHSWPSFVPITFELAVLGAALAMVAGLLVLNGGGRLHHPVFDVPGFNRFSTDRFFLCIERSDPEFDRDLAYRALEIHGLLRIAAVPDLHGQRPHIDRSGVGRSASGAALSVVLAAMFFGAGGCDDGMRDQPKIEAYEASGFFGDGLGMRERIAGTVSRSMPIEKKGAITDRPEINQALLARGQERFNIFCTPCHGRDGYGEGIVVERGYPQPATFHDERLRGVADQHMFSVISRGLGKMPPYRAQIPVHDRWAIVAYIRALQRSQYATIDDVPDEMREQLERSGKRENGEAP